MKILDICLIKTANIILEEIKPFILKNQKRKRSFIDVQIGKLLTWVKETW